MLKFSLDKFMQERNLTIQEVVDSTGISRPTISQLSSGKAKGIQFDTLNKLVLGLETDVYELFETTYPSEDLMFSVNWKSNNLASESFQELMTHDIIGNQYEALFKAGFFSKENIKSEYAVSSFSLPISVAIESTTPESDKLDTVIFSVFRETLPDYAVKPAEEMAIEDYFISSPKDQLEIMLGAISLECIQKLKFNEPPKNVLFRSDVSPLLQEGWIINFSWDMDLISNPKKFEQFINIKYGNIN